MNLELSAIVAIKAEIPDDALSAGLLGTERTGHGVRIRDDGLIVTIGYVIHEAERLWITSSDGMAVPGFAVGYDFDSGLGLVKPSMPLRGPIMPLGSAAALKIGDDVFVCSSRSKDVLDAQVVAKEEFAGRWEYVIDEAIFTAPHHDSWSGAALINASGELCGIGSLVIQGFEVRDRSMTVNMFVPIDLIKPIIEEVCEHGQKLAPPRPWLGVLVQDDHEKLLVVGVYPNCPAHKAGLRAGDVILRIDNAPVDSLAQMFRQIWSLGSAGVEIPMSILRDSKEIKKIVRSGDRVSFQRIGTVQ
jgi:S1-C subfamily serine protease